MDLTPEMFDEIEAYIQNRMTPEARDQFSQRLGSDPELRQEVALQQRLQSGLNTALTRRQFAGVRFERQQQRRQQRQTYAVAASVVLLLIGSVTILINTLNRPSGEAIFVAYYQPEARMRSDESSALNLTAAQNNYYGGRYEQALAQLTKIPDDSLLRVTYYRGLTNLALERTTYAKTDLQRARQSTDSRIQYRADWYLSLTLLRAGHTEQAIPFLRQIADNSQHPFREQATQILRDLL